MTPPRVLRTLIQVPSEHVEQKTLFEWAATQFVPHPELRWLYAIPNAGGEDQSARIRGARMVAEGLKKGYPDVGLDVARGRYHGLRIEMKRREKGKLSVHQEVWRDWLLSQDYAWAECRGWNDATVVILRYLQLPEGMGL